MMTPAVKSAVESALIALLAAAVCLWLLINATNGGDEEISVAKATLLGLGVAFANVAHWAFMAMAIKHSGRKLMPWLLVVILLTPIGTAILLAVLMSDDKPSSSQA